MTSKSPRGVSKKRAAKAAAPPDVLYKYFSPGRIDVLELGKIRFTQPAVFNDPFESSPARLDFGSRKRMERVSKKEAANQGMPEELRREILESMFSASQRKTHFPLLAQVLVTLMARGVGILSLSEAETNLLMWAHHAQSHQGFAIGFRTKDAFLSRPDASRGALHDLRKVQYSRKRPVLRYFSLADIAHMYFTKSIEWSYEREWRMYTLMPPEDTMGLMVAMIRYIAQGREMPVLPACTVQLFDFPPSCVDSVILGCRATTETEQRVTEIASKKYPGATLLRAKPSSTGFELEFERFGRRKP